MKPEIMKFIRDYIYSLRDMGLDVPEKKRVELEHFFREQIQLIVKEERERIVGIIEEVRNEPLPFSADENNPIKHVYQNQGYVKV